MFEYPRYMRIFQHDFSPSLANPAAAHAEFQFRDAGCFLSRQTLVPSKRPGMALWREKLFAGRCHVV
ncbi:hypothetical protein GFM09_28065 [Rhizobium leguminosarum bv. viciae]|nr:hypothetical protein [Rhizobium leguminosarum bv. viciae]